MQVSQKPQKEMQVDSNNLYTVTQQWQIAATEQTEREFKKKTCCWVEWEMFVSFPFISSNHRFFNVNEIFIFAV